MEMDNDTLYDYDDYDFTQDGSSQGHRALWRVVAPSLFALEAAGGVVVNTWVVYRVCCAGQRRPLDMLFLAMALSSMLFLMTIVPLTGYSYVSDSWQLGDVICRLFRTGMFALVCCHAYSLVLLCGHCLGGDPRECCALQSGRSVLLLNLLVWILMLVICSPVYFLSSAHDTPHGLSYCTIERYHDPVVIAFDVIGFLVPVVVGLGLLVKGCSEQRLEDATRLASSVFAAYTLMWLPAHVNNFLPLLVYLPSSLWYTAVRIGATVLAYASYFIIGVIYLVQTAKQQESSNVPANEMNYYHKKEPTQTA